MPKISLEDGSASFECAPNDTILRAGLRAGEPMPYECNVGACGTCKFELVDGEVDVLWDEATGLSERDLRKGRKLACQCVPKTDSVIKLRLDEACRPHVIPRRFEGELIAVHDLTHDMKEFRFKGEGPAEFLPGQYALMSLPGVGGVRAYSMSNIANREGIWDFQIKRVPDGAGTGYLFGDDGFGLGQKIELDGPYGVAYLRPEVERDIVCVAGGSGLAPVVSIARGMVTDPRMDGRKMHFFYGCRGPMDLCGEDMLAELPGYGDRIKFHVAISMPELDANKTWKGRTGFIHEVVKEVLGDSIPEFEYYMAGPPPMVDAVQRMLMMEYEVSHQHVHFDRFF
ncbi:MAG: 2Fe-2S iron-sulfur cluster-binding protein [Alphaproteobacteria bacterium]